MLRQGANAPDAGRVVVSVGTHDALGFGQPLDLESLRTLTETLAHRYQRAALIDIMLCFPLHLRRSRAELAERRRSIRTVLASPPLQAVRLSLNVLSWHRDGIHPNGRGQRRVEAAASSWLT